MLHSNLYRTNCTYLNVIIDHDDALYILETIFAREQNNYAFVAWVCRTFAWCGLNTSE